MNPRPGSTLGRYELLSQIGEGGMGVVWKAHDSSLDREVAIKLLPDSFAADAERLARFEREAKLLASLNHPHIAQIYGLEREGDLRYLVMELVPGENLSQRLACGAMSIAESLRVGVQLAQALEAAHENGVIHRDLKPANVQISGEGDIKVLDFGLAKAFQNESGASPTMTPTVTSAGSRPGMVLGTAAYMSPEQARGQELDKRTDIWALGCVLFECLTGRQAFGGDTVSDALASILRNEPDWSLLPAAVPPRLRELLARCLNKEVRNRQRDSGDLRIELEAIQATGSLPPGTASAGQAAPRRSTNRVAIAGAFLLGAVAGLAAGNLAVDRTSRAPEQLRLSITAPEGWNPYRVQISSDGNYVVYGASSQLGEERNWKLFVRELSSFETSVVEGSTQYDFFDLSADSRQLAFIGPVSTGSSEKRLFTVPLQERARPLELARWDSLWDVSFVWHPDGRFFGITRSPQRLIEMAADGSILNETLELQLGDVQSVVSIGGSSPDGKLLLGSGQSWGPRGFAMHPVTVEIATGRVQIVTQDGEHPKMIDDERILWARRDSLLAARRDPATGRVTGTPRVLHSGMRTDDSWDSARFDIATNGTLVYRTGGRVGLNRRLAFIDQNAEIEYWSEDGRGFEDMIEVSPDGKYVAVVTAGTGTGSYEVWISEIDRPRLRLLAAYEAVDCAGPVWHPTERKVAYSQLGQQGIEGIFVKQVDEGEPQQVWGPTVESFAHPLSFTADGRALAIATTSPEGPRILLIDLTQDLPAKGELLVADARFARFSRDGKWLAYASSSAGQFQVVVRRFTDGRLVGPVIPVSTAGGQWPYWGQQTEDGVRELTYWIANSNYLVRMDDRGGEVRFSRPERTAYSRLSNRIEAAAILPDGRRMAVIKGPEEISIPRIAVVTRATGTTD